MCTMHAPALAASIADAAISGGVTGTAGLREGVSADPVTAQEIITLRCIGLSPVSHSQSFRQITVHCRLPPQFNLYQSCRLRRTFVARPPVGDSDNQQEIDVC